MDKRTIIAFVLSFAVLVGWSLLFGPEQAKPPATENQATEQQKAKEPPTERPVEVAASSGAEQARSVPPQVSEKMVEVETPLYKAIFSSAGPGIKSFKLKGYRETIDPNSPYIELANLPGSNDLHMQIGFTDSYRSYGKLLFQSQDGPVRIDTASGHAELRFKAQTPEGLILTKTFRFHSNSYVIDLTIEVENRSEKPAAGAFAADVRALTPQSKASYYSYVGLVLLKDGKLEELEIEKEDKVLNGELRWMAYEDSYFISAAIPENPIKASFKGTKQSSGLLEGRMTAQETVIPPGGKADARFMLYLGPRDLGILSQAGHGLEQSIDFGWTDIIAKPLLYVMRFFYGYMPNYGVAIILLTILVKILFWPLTHKSYKSMKEMQKLQPIMAKIRERHKGNKEELNKELMNLYKTYKVNPMSGCLPMIIQIPVFFALFRILGSAIELRHAPFMLWINDLSAPDRLFSFPFDIPLMTPPSGIPVLTLLMGASMFIQQKMTPTPGDPSQAKIMMFLPIIFNFMFINFPSGLVLYWLVNNILSIGQQYRIQKRPA
ncbi:MAG: membrane protein insertase YidC [Desulfobacteraceae bacterium]|nr:MAG: membrane protein insertase YidC [Desulfobacteraceae bacterium]